MDSTGSLGPALASVAAFVALLALLPSLVRWLQRKAQGGLANSGIASSRLVSALAVGPQQKVVTVEVGPEGARQWLVLGVTAQNISCLQSIPVPPASAAAPAMAAVPVLPVRGQEAANG